MHLRQSVLCVLFLCTFPIMQGCALFQEIGAGEPPVGADAPAPAGYKPVFIKTTLPVTSAAVGRPLGSIAKLDISNPNKVRLYMHLADSTGAFLSGAALAGKWQQYWCMATDEVNGKIRRMKITPREFSMDDRSPHALALVMDHSGSMGEERARAIQDAAAVMITKKKAEDAIALIKYDNKVVVESALSTDAMQLQSKLQKNGLLGFGGLTAIADGTEYGINELISAGAGYERKAVIIFTDGQDNSSKAGRDQVIALAKKNNIMICAIDFGYGVNGTYLRDMAEATGGLYSRIYSTAEFDDVFEDIYRRLRNYYMVEFEPRDYGKHLLRIKLCLPNSDTVTVSAEYDNTPDIGSVALLDVFFDSDKSSLKQESETALQNIALLMKAYPAMEIEVRGHTDSVNRTKDPLYNQKLSEKRAIAVKEDLVQKRGIEPGRIRAIGMGDSRPVADNSTEEGKARNRRTELIILKK
jgi:VWFA-related protein